MAKYRFEQIAFNSTEKKKPEENDRHVYLGLEHLDSGCLKVTRFGADVAPIGDKLVMRKGDVLFGKRRAYQKKVAIAPFDGIFSAHGMVLRPSENVVDPQFFPFFISSDYFLDAAIKISVGSLSPTINWRDLKNLEFNLPSLEEQGRLATVLQSITNTIETYKNLLTKTDELVKSQFIELFGDPVSNTKQWPIKEFAEIASSRLGKMLDKKKQKGENKFPYLANFNVQWFRFDLSQLNSMDFDENERKEFQLQWGDLLVCEGGEIGRCAIWRNNKENCFYQKALHRVRCNTNIVLPEYLAWWFKFNSECGEFQNISGAKATIAHLPGATLKKMKVAVPKIQVQQEFVRFVEQLDKSKFELEQALSELTLTYKRILAENLG